METSAIERRNNRLGSKLLKPTLKAPADPKKKTGTDTFLPLTTALMGDPDAELFGGQEMGENVLRVLNQYITLFNQIRADLERELPQIRAAAKWAGHLLD